MKITAVAVAPIRVELELPDSTPIGEIRDRIFEQARFLMANNGAQYVVLASSHAELVDSIPYLADLGFPVLTEYVPIQPPEPDWSELTQVGITRTRERGHEDDLYGAGMADWVD